MSGSILLLLALAAPQDTVLRLAFLDVGQGDALVVRSPEGRVAVIDAGPPGAPVAQTLLDLGIDTVDLAIASHAHADHIGGFNEVFERLHVRYFLDNGVPHTTATYARIMELVETRGTTYLEPSARTITLGSVQLRILPPPDGVRDQNGASVGVLIEYGEFRVLTTGDADQPELKHFEALGLPTVSVLKASHHGARNGLTPGWLIATRPTIVVISVGEGNSYGHPDPWALRYYGVVAAEVFRTDVHGEVVVQARSDGTFTVRFGGEHRLDGVRTFGPPDDP